MVLIKFEPLYCICWGWEVTGNPDIALLKSSLENSEKVLWLLPVSLRAGSLVTTVHSQNATALASKSSLGDHQKLFEVTLRESFRKTETGKSVSYGQNPLGPNLASILSSYWSSPKAWVYWTRRPNSIFPNKMQELCFLILKAHLQNDTMDGALNRFSLCPSIEMLVYNERDARAR